MSWWGGRRTQADMRHDADTLVAFLEKTFQEGENLGWRLYPLARQLDWTDQNGDPDLNRVSTTIAWCRNKMPTSRHLIVHFKAGREHAYKIPTDREAMDYLLRRGEDVASRSSHILFLARKTAARYGVTADTRRTERAYTEVLRWLGEAGVENADALLQEALRPLAA